MEATSSASSFSGSADILTYRWRTFARTFCCGEQRFHAFTTYLRVKAGGLRRALRTRGLLRYERVRGASYGACCTVHACAARCARARSVDGPLFMVLQPLSGPSLPPVTLKPRRVLCAWHTAVTYSVGMGWLRGLATAVTRQLLFSHQREHLHVK